MKPAHFLIVIVIAIISSMSGCAKPIDKMRTANIVEIAGTLGGAALGGYVGSQFGGGVAKTAFTTIGIISGGGSGYAGARLLSSRDVVLHNKATKSALAETGSRGIHRWNNPKSGLSGIVRTVSRFTRRDGIPCAKYRSSIVFADRVSSVSGGACQLADGQWLALNNDFH
ncbi:MAG: hypothetical protein CBB68_11520 [Rhodospirillaceae bacterium TMED8]|nr:hypothetical protein [Magnetovibrio sp.]OUT49624.1 MAG: hypothetical protein CBB68_11520 [Rhodospirillaceae bacterium TMED8]